LIYIHLQTFNSPFREAPGLALHLLGPGAGGQRGRIKLQPHPMAAHLKQIRLIAELLYSQVQVIKQLKRSNSGAQKKAVGN